ncbi:hypothetical protein SSS_05785 [Sarcoptes scabiei]|uniref:Uncharacterized protein n=1 Tax=Sarcoptes scabiei TaxID=52283 RepID=A0A834R9Y6_SARSC|nr:hypothetical protein SSS_05785 [Sarcoptes scabiei]
MISRPTFKILREPNSSKISLLQIKIFSHSLYITSFQNSSGPVFTLLSFSPDMARLQNIYIGCESSTIIHAPVTVHPSKSFSFTTELSTLCTHQNGAESQSYHRPIIICRIQRQFQKIQKTM